MSKKHKKLSSQTFESGVGLSHEAEYRIIKFDLVLVCQDIAFLKTLINR